MVSYNPDTDDFFITSKSSPDSEFSAWLKAMFYENVNDVAGLNEYLKRKNVTMVFECVDMENDPHIIKYDKSHLFLLDIVKINLNMRNCLISSLFRSVKSSDLKLRHVHISL